MNKNELEYDYRQSSLKSKKVKGIILSITLDASIKGISSELEEKARFYQSIRRTTQEKQLMV